MSDLSIKQLWDNWNTAILNKLSKDNECYTLTNGVSDEQIQELQNQLGFPLPPVLIEFYKTHNVISNDMQSAFSLTGIDDLLYYLLPFEEIFDIYTEILTNNDDFEEGIQDEYDEKLQCEIYANPKWIPFAHNFEGDYFMIDTDPSEQGDMYQIIDLQNESWKRIVIARSLQNLIKDNIEKINQNSDDRFKHLI